MALDTSFVGRTYPPTEPYEVGREKIREFATALGDAHPAYLDPEAARSLGYADVIAPPTFAIVVSMAAGDQVVHDPALGLDYSRVVHSDQRFTYTRPIVAGDRLTAIVTVDSVKSALGNDMIGTRCELSDADGQPVVVAYSTLVSRGSSS